MVNNRMENELQKNIEDLLNVEKVLTRVLEKIETLDETITSVTQSQKDFKTDLSSLTSAFKDLEKKVVKPLKEIKTEINTIHQDIYNQNEKIESINKKYDDLLTVIRSLDKDKDEEVEEKEKPPVKEKTPIKTKIKK